MDKLTPLINELVEVIQKSVSVVSGQLPDIAKQIVRYYLWGNLIEVPILIGLMYLGFYWAKKALDKAKEDNWAESPWLIAWFPIIILEFIIGFNAWAYLDTLLKAMFAPKLLIIETLRNFIH